MSVVFLQNFDLVSCVEIGL